MSTVARIITRSLGAIPLDRRSCQLLGPTALVVQALMGILAILSLVYKRHRETQKRPWGIWLFDVSKQVVGAMFVHLLNVLISNFGSDQSSGNACTYYFLNILIDTTLGVWLIYVVLQSSTWLLSKILGIKGLKSGQYGNPPSFSYWVRQATVYLFALTAMKFFVVALFAIWPGISTIGDWLLAWTTLFDGESVQVIFVMGVFPMIMNVVQFWLIDSIVKASPVALRTASSRNSDSQDRQPLFNPPDDNDGSPRDIEDGPQSSTSRTASEGDFKTFVGVDDSNLKLSPSGSSTPLSLPRAVGVVAHDYSTDIDNTSPHSSTRSRHKYRQASSPVLDLPITYSAAAVDTADSLRSAAGDTAEIDALEKSDWEERVGGERNNRRSGQNLIPISAR